jgi:glycosyltransferase involved in cell wall biosynthesis
VTAPLAILVTHPIQYYSPWFARLARRIPLKVFYAHRQDAQGQAKAGFQVGFDWDVPLLEGYEHQFLRNASRRPGLDSFWGCDTPDISAILRGGHFGAALLFGWNKKSYLQGWRAARGVGIPVLVRLDSQLGKPRWGRMGQFAKSVLYSAVLPRAADYLSPGRRTDEYLAAYEVPPARIHRLPHMVDVERFARGATNARFTGAAAAFRAQNGAAAGDFIYLFTGKMIAKKRPDLLLEAFRRLSAVPLGEGRRALLWMAGAGPMEEQLRIQAAGLSCTFLGFVNQSQLPCVYAAADCLVLPSDRGETWGLVVNEAFACGTPAIVSQEAGCAPELVRDGKTGWLMLRDEPDHLAGVMATAAASSGSLSRESISRFAECFSFESGCDRFTEILDAAARNGPGN